MKKKKRMGAVKVPGQTVLQRLLRQLAPQLRLVDSLQDPRNLYVRCLECGGL